MAPRKRFKGTPDALAAALMPVCSPAGVAFLNYDECERVGDAKLNVGQVEENHDLLEALHGQHPQMSFAKSTIKAALRLVLDACRKTGGEKWYLNEEHEESWLRTMVNRIANLTHCVHQGELKHPQKSSLGNALTMEREDQRQ